MKNKNLIGISGRLGSGKDTVGQIINYLVWKNKIENGAPGSLNHTLSGFLNNTASNTYKVKKFADKLKDIVCMLIGCTRAQLEDRDFKEKELVEQWDKFQLTIYNTSNYLDESGNVGYSYPREYNIILEDRDQYKLYLEKNDNFNKDEINIWKKTNQTDLVHETTHRLDVIKMTPRLLLQLLGTEAGRGIIHNNIWVNSLMSEYVTSTFTPFPEDIEIGEKIIPYYPSWVITDMRFPNELDAITKRGGISIRVERLQEINDLNPHKSETALDNAQFDYKIINNGSIHDLVEEVKKILIKENIIRQ